MSSTIAQPSNMKSMNGIVTYDDGAGTVISGGVIVANSLNTQNLTAPDPTATSGLYATSTGTITIGTSTSPVIVSHTCANPTEVANKAYVDSVSSGGVTLAGTNVWTGQNTFDNYAPLCSTYPSVDDNLANKLYVDNVAGTVGGALLADNNIWTGTNEFNNDVTLGGSSLGNIITLQGDITIGNNTSSPGPIVTLQGDYQLLRGLATPIGTYLSSNRTSFGGDSEPAQMVVDISVLDEVTIEFRTNSLSIPQVNSSIVGSGGTTTLGGTLALNSGNINIGNSDLSTDVTLQGDITIGNNTTSPGPTVTIQGDYQILRGLSSVIGTYLNSNKTSFGGDSEPAQMVVDISVLDKVTMEFRTNSLSIPQVNSTIVGYGGTTTLGGTLELNSGSIYVGNSTNNTVNYIRGSTNNFQSNDNNFGASASTQSMEMDTSVSGTSSLNFKTNTGNTAQISSRIVATGGTATNNGTLTTTAGAIISNANSFRVGSASTTGPSVTFDTTTSSEIEMLFKTNTADPTMDTVRVKAASGTVADGGRFSFFASIVEWYQTSIVFWSKALTESLLLDIGSTAYRVAMNFRTSTSPSSTGVTTASIIATNGTTAGTGTLTTTCAKSITKSGTGNTALEITPATNLSTIDFKSSSANNTITASIIASGGTATALSGTLDINASTIDVNGTTLNMNATTTAFPTGTSITLSSPSSGGYPFYDGGNKCVTISSATTIDNFTTVYDTLFVVPHSNGTNFTISLKGVATDVNTGNVFRIFNNGSSSVTVATTNSTNRLVGPAIARNGNFTYTLASNASIRVQTIKPSGNPFNQTSANQNGYFISLC